MSIYDIKHEVIRGRMSAWRAYEIVKANADRPFYVTAGQLEEFKAAAFKEIASKK